LEREFADVPCEREIVEALLELDDAPLSSHPRVFEGLAALLRRELAALEEARK